MKKPKPKSLGQIAHESIREKYAKWQQIGEIIIEDWDIAARAVEREVLRRLKPKPHPLDSKYLRK